MRDPGNLVRLPQLAGVGLFYIGHRLGRTVASEKWLRARVDWLIANHGFPPPLPSPRKNERIFSRRAVDAWFDGQLNGPGGSEVTISVGPAPDPNLWATVLDARAAGLDRLVAEA